LRPQPNQPTKARQGSHPAVHVHTVQLSVLSRTWVSEDRESWSVRVEQKRPRSCSLVPAASQSPAMKEGMGEVTACPQAVVLNCPLVGAGRLACKQRAAQRTSLDSNQIEPGSSCVPRRQGVAKHTRHHCCRLYYTGLDAYLRPRRPPTEWTVAAARAARFAP